MRCASKLERVFFSFFLLVSFLVSSAPLRPTLLFVEMTRKRGKEIVKVHIKAAWFQWADHGLPRSFFAGMREEKRD